MFGSKSENRDRAVEAVESVSKARACQPLQRRERVEPLPKLRARVRVRREICACLIPGSNSVTVFVPLRRYR